MHASTAHHVTLTLHAPMCDTTHTHAHARRSVGRQALHCTRRCTDVLMCARAALLAVPRRIYARTGTRVGPSVRAGPREGRASVNERHANMQTPHRGVWKMCRCVQYASACGADRQDMTRLPHTDPINRDCVFIWEYACKIRQLHLNKPGLIGNKRLIMHVPASFGTCIFFGHTEIVQ